MGRPKRLAPDRGVRESTAGRYGTETVPPSRLEILADTDILIDLLREHPTTIATMLRLDDAGAAVLYTPVTIAEIYSGIRPEELLRAERLLSPLRAVVLDVDIGRRAGTYLARYARSHGVRIADALIAAAASTNGLRLWTRNRKHYPMPDVELFEG